MIWSACRQTALDEAQARDAFDAVCLLAEYGLERLRAYDGRSRLTTFVALLCHDLLAQRLMQLLRENVERGWRALEAFFRADIEGLIRRRLPGPAHAETRRDAWQEICAGLLDEDCRRLRAFSGSGSLIGFVPQTADRGGGIYSHSSRPRPNRPGRSGKTERCVRFSDRGGAAGCRDVMVIRAGLGHH